MIVRTLATADEVAAGAAEWLAEQAREAIAARGRFALALSGGRTPWVMLRAFVSAQLPWDRVHLFQVDERVAPDGHTDRNWTHISDVVAEAPNPAARAMALHPMPAGDPCDERPLSGGGGHATFLARAPQEYVTTLEHILGAPPVLDVVHLGLGSDGHTASLIPGDPILEATRHDVGVTSEYQGRRRLTLTYPAIGRARAVLWVVTGVEKREMVARLLASDPSIPAGRVRAPVATLMVDRAASPDVAPGEPGATI